MGPLTINGGTLSPGNSIGQLNVQGNLVLTAAATYLVEVDPANADSTVASGTASLAGTVRASFASGAYLMRSLHDPNVREPRRDAVRRAQHGRICRRLHRFAQLHRDRRAA